jgi:hypothetical protein
MGTLQSSGRFCAYDAIQIPYNIDRAKTLPGLQSRILPPAAAVVIDILARKIVQPTPRNA